MNTKELERQISSLQKELNILNKRKVLPWREFANTVGFYPYEWQITLKELLEFPDYPVKIAVKKPRAVGFTRFMLTYIAWILTRYPDISVGLICSNNLTLLSHKKTIKAILANVEFYNLDNIRFMDGSPSDFGVSIPECDILFIDEYEFIKNIFENWYIQRHKNVFAGASRNKDEWTPIPDDFIEHKIPSNVGGRSIDWAVEQIQHLGSIEAFKKEYTTLDSNSGTKSKLSSLVSKIGSKIGWGDPAGIPRILNLNEGGILANNPPEPELGAEVEEYYDADVAVGNYVVGYDVVAN